MKAKGIFVLIGAIAVAGCHSGDTAVETYQPAPGQVTNPSAPPGQAGQPQSMQEAVQANPNMPPAAKDALLRGRK